MHHMLEAKIVLGENLVVNIGTEFIKNEGSDKKTQKKRKAEEIKQDCELKAFKRFAIKIKSIQKNSYK